MMHLPGRALSCSVAALALLQPVVGCGGSDPAAEPDTGSDTDAATTASPGEDTSTGEPDPTTAAPDGSSSSSGEGDSDSGGEEESTGDPTGEPSPWDGEPLPDAPVGDWLWVDFPDALCRNGTPTGIGVRRGAGDGLVIYFEGGGACFNGLTCTMNPASYGENQFAGFAASGDNGIFDPDPGKNPVGDWSFIYVPYCTGDVHAGDSPDTTVPDFPGVQQFVGYRNVEAYLERIVPTFADVSQVMVTGQSAGGFGAAFNYDRIADAFPGTDVMLLDDSGPPLPDDVVAPCLQQTWRDLWGFDSTLPAECADCFPPDGGGISNLARFIGTKHQGQRLALLSSTADSTIRFFFGFGANNCNVVFPNTSPEAFEAGLVDLRDNYLNAPPDTWATFYIDDSEQHTWLSGSLYSAESGGVQLVDWVRDLVEGQVSHVGP